MKHKKVHTISDIEHLKQMKQYTKNLEKHIKSTPLEKGKKILTYQSFT